jgi:hypothetical protein
VCGSNKKQEIDIMFNIYLLLRITDTVKVAIKEGGTLPDS